MGINVFGDATTTEDYRIPDLTFVAAGRQHIIAADGIRGGGPDAVVEVRSRRPVHHAGITSRDSRLPRTRLTGAHLSSTSVRQ
jgi:hypothetical protein